MDNHQNEQANHIEQARALLSPYIDGEVSAAERELVETALARWPQLKVELESLRHTVSLVNRLPRASAPRPFTLTEADIGRVPPAKPSPFRGWFKPLVGAAAALTAVVVAGAVLFSLNAPPAREAASVALAPQAPAAQKAVTAPPVDVQAEAVEEPPPPAEAAVETEAEAAPETVEAQPEAEKEIELATEIVVEAPAVAKEAEAPPATPMALQVSPPRPAAEANTEVVVGAASEAFGAEGAVPTKTEIEDRAGVAERAAVTQTVPTAPPPQPAAPEATSPAANAEPPQTPPPQTGGGAPPAAVTLPAITPTPAVEPPPGLTRRGLQFWLIAPAVALVVLGTIIVVVIFSRSPKDKDNR